MGRPLIVVGDKTSHGGTVVEGTSMTDSGGKLISCVGHKVTCPRRGHGTNSIATGDPTLIIDGKPAARHGDTTACGATLISSQIASNVSDETSAPIQMTMASSGVASASNSAPLANEIQEGTHDQHFVLTNNQTGEPLEHVRYKIHLADGRSYDGVTDGQGKTAQVYANSPIGVKIEVLL